MKVKVSCVSYINSLPFVYGLENFSVKDDIVLSKDVPSACAEKLIHGTADVGLVPVAAIPEIPGAEVISNYCIAAEGEVKSVLLVSDVPLHEIGTILLDYQSITSAKLIKICCNEFWNIEPEFEQTSPGFEELIGGQVAALIIGDRALKARMQYKYVYDLAGEWKNNTGLPFVFACWVSNRKLSPAFLTKFNESLARGLDHTREVIASFRPSTEITYDLTEYLTDNLSFVLDDLKIESINRFLQRVTNGQGSGFKVRV